MRYDLTDKTAENLKDVLANPRAFKRDSKEFSVYLLLAGCGEDRDSIVCERLLDWARENAEYNVDDDAPAIDLARSMIETLESIDRAGCCAPSGLIYTADLYRHAADIGADIDDSLSAYADETSEQAAPRDGAFSVGWAVWFAYEWKAHQLAGLMRSVFGIDE